MRIMIIAHGYPPTVGGVESHLWDISQALAARGHVVRCLVGGRRRSVETVGIVMVSRAIELSVPYLLSKQSKHSRFRSSEALMAQLERLVAAELRSFRPDVIHFHNPHFASPAPANAVFSFVSGDRLFSTIHNYLGEYVYPEILRLPWAHTLFVSESVKRHAPRAEPSSVMSPGIDLTVFTPKGPVHELLARLERPVIFHPARLLPWKGGAVSVEAFTLLRRAVGAGTLVFSASRDIADGKRSVQRFERQLRRLAANRGVTQWIRYLQFRREEMSPAYRASDIVWHPTIDEEPYGLIPLEAMACAVPLVVSESGGTRETVANDQSGLVVAKGDPNGLAYQSERLLKDRSLRQRIALGGLQRASLYGNDSYVDRLELLYGNLLR